MIDDGKNRKIERSVIQSLEGEKKREQGGGRGNRGEGRGREEEGEGSNP